MTQRGQVVDTTVTNEPKKQQYIVKSGTVKIYLMPSTLAVHKNAIIIGYNNKPNTCLKWTLSEKDFNMNDNFIDGLSIGDCRILDFKTEELALQFLELINNNSGLDVYKVDELKGPFFIVEDFIDMDEKLKAPKKSSRALRVFLSQPMKGKSIEEIEEARDKYINQILESIKDDIFVHDNIQTELPEDTPSLVYLSNDIKMLADTDVVYFAPDYQSARGCRIEKAIAIEYNIPCYYL
jgi:hypothetical protein